MPTWSAARKHLLLVYRVRNASNGREKRIQRAKTLKKGYLGSLGRFSKWAGSTAHCASTERSRPQRRLRGSSGLGRAGRWRGRAGLVRRGSAAGGYQACGHHAARRGWLAPTTSARGAGYATQPDWPSPCCCVGWDTRHARSDSGAARGVPFLAPECFGRPKMYLEA